MKRTMKKWMAMSLAIILCLGLVQTTAWADTDSGTEGVAESGENVTDTCDHEYGDPVFIWDEDYKCTAQFTCIKCGDVQEIKCNVGKTTTATCTEAGMTTYTAVARLDGVSYRDVLTLEVPAAGHNIGWNAGEYPAGNESGMIACYTCSVCQARFADAEATIELSRDATTLPLVGSADVESDKSALEKGVEEAKTLQMSDYTLESWGRFSSALEVAEYVIKNGAVSQSVVDASLTVLEIVTDYLVRADGSGSGPVVDTTALEKAIKDAESLSENSYTAASWKVLQEALDAARDVVKDDSTTRKEVDAALDVLQAAVASLVKADTSDNGGNSGNNGNGNNGNTGSGSGVTNVEKIGGTWTYTVDGKADYSYTGFASNANGKWYVEKGIVSFKKNDVLKDSTGAIGTKGTWYYIVGSKVQTGYTGVANYKNSSGWWYIKKGQVDFSANTVAKNNNGWWYVTGGKVQFGYTGVANYKNSSGWWYIKGGKVDFSANTVAKNNSGWWYVEGGKVNFNYTNRVSNYKNANGWWYIKNGKVDFSFTGRASNKNGTWNVVNGKVRF